MTPVSAAPSGEQWEIASGELRATVVEVGGGVRTFTAGGRDVLEPYPVGAICDAAHGTPLVPWPNRLEDGRYTFDGVEHQLPLTEPARHNAIHGLLRWQCWRAVERTGDRVVVQARIHPRTGYPFDLSVRVEYAFADAGLTVTTTATNQGATACPYASGHHPYLSPGAGLVDDCTLSLAAATRITTDPDRQLPIGTEEVAGTVLDFAAGRKLGAVQIDSAFTDLARDAEGLAWARLTGSDGATVELWQDAAYPVTEVFTGDSLVPDRRRRGLAVEPMTAPPNAFRTGSGLQRLEPGEAAVGVWGARLR
jgi:aldose 1-epimerase